MTPRADMSLPLSGSSDVLPFGPSDALDLSVIIVNWNTRDLLAECLRSVYDTVHDLAFEVFVVDNASSDGSVAMVREQFPDVHLIDNADNVGFARANNQSIVKANGEYLLLLNPDTVLGSGAIKQLVGFMEARPAYALVGAQLLNPDGTEQGSWGRFPGLRSELPLVNRLYPPPPLRRIEIEENVSVSYLDVPWVSGACLLLRRALITEVGVLDEAFWLYTEETDLCQRARQRGHRVASVTSARVWHYRRAASGQRMIPSMLWFYQSKVRFVAKHQGRLSARAVKSILRWKAMIWRRSPHTSPLGAAYPDASGVEIASAYSALVSELGRTVPGLLERSW
ncbi:MAG: glycosyltransferase family 2 protein [Anaerolineae bacterium]